MKLLGSTESKITKNEKGCDIVNSIYQRNSRVLYTFGPNKFYILKNIWFRIFVQTISIQISVFSVIWLGMIRLKSYSFDDMGIQMM